MSRRLRITTLTENTTRDRHLMGEHGLSLWLETSRRRILFDTGQGKALFANARDLGIDLSTADTVILSHGHYDHAGGLAGVLEIAPQARVYVHPQAFSPKFSRNLEGVSRDIGTPIPEGIAMDRVIWTEECTDLGDGFMVTGGIPRITDYEDTGGPFFTDSEPRSRDALTDDQALYFQSTEGVVVIVGCAHAGVVNTLNYIRELTTGKPIHTLVGGMHLENASRNRLDQTLVTFRQLNLQKIGIAHCTGPKAAAELHSVFPAQSFDCSVGTVLEYQMV